MTTKPIALPAAPLVALLLAAVPSPALAQDTAGAETSAPAREGDPGFRTDLGVHLAFGGHSCIGGGTGYASCFGEDNSWDTSWGLGGGVILRPFRYASMGIDVGYVNMIYHQQTENGWSDFTIGPVLRGHLPLHLDIRIAKLYVEPTLGIQLGYVEGNYHQSVTPNGTKGDFDHPHLGAFIAVPLGFDVFPIPRLGVGLELRLIRTFYDEVCFEMHGEDDLACRGSDDDAITTHYTQLEKEGQLPFPGEPGLADYPWKLLWALHGIYYF